MTDKDQTGFFRGLFGGRTPRSEPRLNAINEIQGRLDSIVNAMSGIGDVDDRHTHNVPGGGVLFTEDWLDKLYEHDKFSQIIVDRPARDATRAGWQIIVDENEENDPFAPYFEALKVEEKFRTAHTLARLTGGAGILIVTDDPAPLDEPIDFDRVKKVKTLQVFDRFELTPLEWNNDVESDGFGLPLTYALNPAVVGGATPIDYDYSVIHSDRIVRFLGRPLRRKRQLLYDGWGQPILEAVWEAISDISTISQAVASTAHQFQYTILKLKNLMSLLTGPQGEPNASKLNQRLMAMRLSMSAIKAIVIDADREELEQRNVDFTGIERAYEIAQQNFAMVTGMPLSLIFGQAPHGFSEKDETGLENYRAVIEAEQKEFYRPGLLQLAKLIAISEDSPTNGEIPDLEVKFGNLEGMDLLDEAEIRLRTARMDRLNIDAGIYSYEEARKRYEEAEWSMELVLPKGKAPGPPDRLVRATNPKIETEVPFDRQPE